MNPRPPLLTLLRPRSARWGAIRASGRWSVSFPARGDMLFFRVDRGRCQFRMAGAEPLPLGEADILVARTCAPLTLGSHTHGAPTDSWSLVARTRSTEMRLGDAGEPSSLIRGGRFTFEGGDRDPLLRLLPPLVHVPRDSARSERVRALLAMLEVEGAEPDPWSGSVSAHLLEVLIMELLRQPGRPAEPDAPGLLAGLSDPVVSRALDAMHGDIARHWTLRTLASLCGRSRSAFSQRFAVVLGVAPMTYLQRLRMEVARDELRRGRRRVAEIALSVGFQSSSAFSTAFTRAVGCSPSRYATDAQESPSVGERE